MKKPKENYPLALGYLFKSYSLKSQIGDSHDLAMTLVHILNIRDKVLGLAEFKGVASLVYSQLPPKTQNQIPFKEFLKEPTYRVEPKTGRNASCVCGSGKKFKNCHGME
ncbi:SEC-C metal-binding domain-containing protein [Mucilaginibacter sp.]|uniref:SEC-C metal-binding domain-containing protein n=1 Tax=Mucilaginibacter sp. TaxID=1882438 RepID=UPI0026282C8E|nr:SEC-C metal-binding domain-containing protein [Mucilaginibacter sp.]MDB4918976.1 hypothetical protein [Mucilaginibacter sp.]